MLVVVDQLTKFVFIKAMREATASNVVKFLVEQVFQQFGVPETVHSDNGKQFVSKEFQKMTDDYKYVYLVTICLPVEKITN